MRVTFEAVLDELVELSCQLDGRGKSLCLFLSIGSSDVF